MTQSDPAASPNRTLIFIGARVVFAELFMEKFAGMELEAVLPLSLFVIWGECLRRSEGIL